MLIYRAAYTESILPLAYRKDDLQGSINGFCFTTSIYKRRFTGRHIKPNGFCGICEVHSFEKYFPLSHTAPNCRVPCKVFSPAYLLQISRSRCYHSRSGRRVLQQNLWNLAWEIPCSSQCHSCREATREWPSWVNGQKNERENASFHDWIMWLFYSI